MNERRWAELGEFGWVIPRGEGMMPRIVDHEVEELSELLAGAKISPDRYTMVIERGKRPTARKLRKIPTGKDSDSLLPMGEE